MGTRNLTVVIFGGKPRICQYGQWDGYPTYSGKVIQRFLESYVSDPEYRIKFIRNLGMSASFYPGMEDAYEAMCEKRRAKGLSMAHDTRDTGAEILEWLAETNTESLGFYNDLEFMKDGLFNEFTYVFDVDMNTLSVYAGEYNGDLYETGAGNMKAYDPLSEYGIENNLGFVGTWMLDGFVEADMNDLEDFIRSTIYGG